VRPDDGEFGAQGGWVFDRERCGFSILMVPFSDSIQAWSVGVPGRPKCWAIAHRARNSRVEPEVIWGPLSDTASRIGRASSSTPRSMVPSSWRASTASSRPSASSAAVKATSTWVWVSSLLTISVIHLRLTRSSMISTAIPARVKWVVSKIQIEFGLYSTQSGNGRFFDRPGRGSGRKCRSARCSTRRTVDGETHTRDR
jgi:hypothetical protein